MAGFRLTKALGLEAPRSPQRDTQAKAVTSMQARQPLYTNIQRRGTAMVDQFQPQQVQAGQGLVDYYKAGPDAGGMNAENATMLRGQDTGYAMAGAKLRSLGARTGADVGGSLATLEAGHVASAFPIQQSIAARRKAEIERFKRGALVTTGQLTGTGMGIEAQGLGGGQNLDSSIYGAAGGLAAADEARKAATYNRIMQFAQQAGQIAGGIPPRGRSTSGAGTGAVNLGAGGNVVQGPDGSYFDPSQEAPYFDPYGQPGGDGYDYSYYPGSY